jgi:hypothetical protein
MKAKLPTSTAVGALLATSSYSSAEGWGVRVFGGFNIVGDENKSLGTTTKVFSTGFSGIPGTFATYIGTFFGTLTGNAAYSANVDFDADGGFVTGVAVGYQGDTRGYRYFRGPEIDDVTLSMAGSTTVVDIDYDY